MRTLVIALVLAAGCSKDNANYCANAPDHNCSEMVDAAGGGDGPMGCASTTDCTNSAQPVCDTGKHACVACSAGEIGACGGTTPVCDTASETCQRCVAHADCGSPGACLPDGSCGTDANVAWVAPGATGACTHGAPCGSIAQALALNLPYVKLATGTYAEAVSVSRSVTMLADAGAKVTAAGGTALAIHGTSTVVTVHDLRIAGSSLGVTVGAGEGSTVALDHVIVDDNTSTGLYISSGTLSMSRCVVSGNAGGGANISATFHISNSIFVANGSGTSTTGGLTLMPATSSDFTFNTVADNLSTSGTSTVRGINCTIPMAIASSILSGNAVSGNCTVDYSLFDTGTATAHNKVGAPMFANVDPADPTASNYYRVQSTSAAIDSADPASSLSDDIDEHHRPIGTTFDIGASEFKP